MMKNAKEARLHAILDAATELLVEKPTASLTDIANYAGIGIATLHRYIENREQLMLQLGFRAVQVVSETMNEIPVDEEKLESYIPRLVEALIPLGDKIYFLAHECSVNYSSELLAAEDQLKEPIRQTIIQLQKQGYLRQDMTSEWMLNVLYSLLFTMWQQVQEGNIAKNSAALLIMETVFNGIKAK